MVGCPWVSWHRGGGYRHGQDDSGFGCNRCQYAISERVLLLVPTIVLQEQWVARMQRYLPDARVANLGGAVSDGAPLETP
jgi:hypothetical protein